MALAAFINYVDRGNLATAGPVLQTQFALSNTQLGLLLSAFFWSYAPGQLPAGWLSERLDPRRVLAVGLAVWGAATVATGIASGFVMLLLLRLALGFGESVMYPATFKILACEVPEGQRGRANGLLAAGQIGGPAFGTLAGGLLMVWLGWRATFLIFGAASLLWLWPWLTTLHRSGPWRSPDVSESPTAKTVLGRRELWGSCLGGFCEAYSLYLIISWLPVYLVKARGLSLTEMARLGALIYAVSALANVLTGWLSDRLLQAGVSLQRVRMGALLVGFAGVSVCFSVCALAERTASLVALIACGVFLGILVTSYFATAQTLPGPGAAGRWFAIQNFAANLAGVSAPVVTGVVVDRTGSFSSALLIAAVLALVGMAAFLFIVRRIEPVAWQALHVGRIGGPATSVSAASVCVESPVVERSPR
jgi:MFS family permease